MRFLLEHRRLRCYALFSDCNPWYQNSQGFFLIEYIERPVLRNILPIALIMGALAGLVAGGYLNVVNVPVMEWSISLEEAAAAASGDVAERGIVISLGVQRIGMVAGLVILGVLFGAIFTGLFHLIRRATPGWNMWAWGMLAGILGFWAISLLVQIRYPLNPPGVGEESSLLARQAFQFLFVVISLISVSGVCIGLKFINESDSKGIQRFTSYLAVTVVYLATVVVAAFAFPSNPDPTPDWMPPELVILFRTFSLSGHLLLWAAISLGVVGYLKYNELGIRANKL